MKEKAQRFVAVANHTINGLLSFDDNVAAQFIHISFSKAVNGMSDADAEKFRLECVDACEDGLLKRVLTTGKK